VEARGTVLRERKMKEWNPEELSDWEGKMRKLAEERERHRNSNLPVPAKVKHKRALKASYAFRRGVNRARERVQEHNQAFVSSMRYEIAHAAWVLGNIFRLGVFLCITAVGVGYFFMVVSKGNGVNNLFFLANWLVNIIGGIQLPGWAEKALAPLILTAIFATGIISPFLFIALFLIIPAIIYRFLFPRENTRLVHFFPEYWIMRAAVGDAVEEIIKEKLQRRRK